jgi:hypothetical protein
MWKKIGFFCLFLIVAGCVERYEFVVRDPSPTLVVEGHISDKSFNETLAYPSDGRHFTVKLTLTGDVTNQRPTPVKGASVQLLASDSLVFPYTPQAAGVYVLLDNSFKALPGVKYRLRITLEDESIYESDWEAMPAVDVPAMAEITFSEGEKQMYVMEANEWVVRTKRIVSTQVFLPENNTGETIHYRWTYSPTWIYIAPLSSVSDPGHKCWATDPHYLNTYAVQSDQAGGYIKDLFSGETVRNARFFEKFSALITQHTMTEAYFNFWKETKEQNEGSSLSDTPPYNLKTNIVRVDGEERVSGYFGVVREQARRWYFNRKDLSYHVENTLKADCEAGTDPPAPECFNCLQYSFGKTTNIQPVWWEN